MGASDDVLELAAAWRRGGRGVALATVVETWGSSPRPPGSQLVVAADGSFAGSVSGGCVEGAVVEKARAVIETGEPELLEFGVTNQMAWEVGLACGGRVRIFVQPVGRGGGEENATLPDALLERLLVERASKRPIALAIDLRSGRARLVDPLAAEAEASCDNALLAPAWEALDHDRSLVHEADAGSILLKPFNPPLRMVVVGAVHIAQTLASMAGLSGYEVVVVDPRSAFASEERFPGVTISHEWPEDALAALAPDRRTAVVVLTHDPKLDEPALAAALRSEAFYVGALGSRRTQAARLGRLRKQGFGEDALARIHGPIGLAIGARSPEEIAVAILAEVTSLLRGGAGAAPETDRADRTECTDRAERA